MLIPYISHQEKLSEATMQTDLNDRAELME